MTYKLKVKDANFLVPRRGDGNGVTIEMLDFAGCWVTTTDVSDKENVSVDEDDDGHAWASWMFEDFPKVTKPKSFKLKSSIQDNHEAAVHADGSIEIGCEHISVEVIDQIHAVSMVARADAKVKAKSKKKKR